MGRSCCSELAACPPPGPSAETGSEVGASEVAGDSVMTGCADIADEGDSITRIGGRGVSKVERVADSVGKDWPVRSSLVGEAV